MESAYEDIGLEPFGNIHDTFMGTAADKNFFAVFMDKKIMFMAEIIGHTFLILNHIESETA